MGVNDRRRFRAFANFIHKTYPNARKIADVAGGHGNLSYYLCELGYDATIIDSRDAHLRRWIHRILRKRSIKQGTLVKIPRVISKVQDVDLRPFDLIVALHPDEATEHAVYAAIKHDKDFAIVPCCVFPIDGIKRSERDWCEHLASLSTDIMKTRLPIYGANIVLYRSRDTAGEPINRLKAAHENAP